MVCMGQEPIARSSPQPAMVDRELPALYRAADRNAQRGQRRCLTATGLRLGALLVAAFLGLFTWRTRGADVAGMLGAIAFGGALTCELYLLSARPDRLWYDGRAAAESAKTLTWRYLVGGSPLGKDEGTDRDAEGLLLRRFSELARELRGVHLVPTAEGADQITHAMRSVRALPLPRRREHYLVNRVRDQQHWYARRARWNEGRALRWSIALTSLEALGLAGAVLKASGKVQVDLMGLAGALVAAGVAWTQTKQHQTLATAYALASQELSYIAARVEWPSTEQEWAHFVDESEEAISREHTLWRASHT
jgi:hypothetical protein